MTTSADDSLGIVAEILTLVGFVGATVFGISALVLWLSRGPWRTAAAVIADGELRWMSADGSFHSAPPPTDADWPGDEDDLHIFYRSRSPEVYYAERVAHDEKTCRMVAVCLLVVGVLATVGSGVLTLVS